MKHSLEGFVDGVFDTPSKVSLKTWAYGLRIAGKDGSLKLLAVMC